jgi:hypothetical protein
MTMQTLMHPQPSASGTLMSPSSRIGFDWAVVLLSTWMISGIHLDAWAHHAFAVETFFTPWHGVLYSGFLATAVALVGTLIRNVRQGHPWQQAMPGGYCLSLYGVIFFLVGGVGDMLWHIVFGIERNLEALISPTHLLLGLGGAFIVTGPLRAAWLRPAQRGGWTTLGPALLSVTLLLTVFTFFTAYANPLSEAAMTQGQRPIRNEDATISQALGMASILVQTNILMGLVLLIVRRWTLPFGAFTLIILASTALGVSVHEDFYLLPAALLTGLVIDVLYWLLEPAEVRPSALRLFAFLVPAAFYTFYFITLSLNHSLWWSVHLWAGAITLAGIAGWLVSYAYLPPMAEDGMRS